MPISIKEEYEPQSQFQKMAQKLMKKSSPKSINTVKIVKPRISRRGELRSTTTTLKNSITRLNDPIFMTMTPTTLTKTNQGGKKFSFNNAFSPMSRSETQSEKRIPGDKFTSPADFNNQYHKPSRISEVTEDLNEFNMSKDDNDQELVRATDLYNTGSNNKLQNQAPMSTDRFELDPRNFSDINYSSNSNRTDKSSVVVNKMLPLTLKSKTQLNKPIQSSRKDPSIDIDDWTDILNQSKTLEEDIKKMSFTNRLAKE